jgi:hypothetical protein
MLSVPLVRTIEKALQTPFRNASDRPISHCLRPGCGRPHVLQAVHNKCLVLSMVDYISDGWSMQRCLRIRPQNRLRKTDFWKAIKSALQGSSRFLPPGFNLAPWRSSASSMWRAASFLHVFVLLLSPFLSLLLSLFSASFQPWSASLNPPPIFVRSRPFRRSTAWAVWTGWRAPPQAASRRAWRGCTWTPHWRNS